MIKQAWTVSIGEKQIEVEYSCSPFSGKTTLLVDGDKFTVRGKPFGIGLCRREFIMIGGEQAVLDVKKGGRATLICREADVTEH